MAPELLRSIPRPVRLTAAGRAVTMVAFALLAGAIVSGSWLYVEATHDSVRYQALQDNAVATQGEVVEIRRTGGKSPERVVIYRYEVSGQSYRGRSSVHRSFRPGSPIELRYLPSEPARSWVAGHPPTGVPLWSAPVVSLAFALGPALIFYKLRRQRRMLSEGRAAEARVTRSRRVQKGEVRQTRVYFEFTLLSGATREGHYDAGRKGPPPGSAIAILYDPDDPRRTAPYPAKLYRIGS